MGNKMLIDAAHPEETRVVVLRGNRIEEFDFEAASKKQLRGNIYLAKVTRVEPSLQAAFIEYGGNKHGFLAFAEIHPDYYQIPVADRQALLEEEALAQDDEHDEEPRSPSNGGGGGGNGGRRSRRHRRGGERGSAEKRTARSDETLAGDDLVGVDLTPVPGDQPEDSDEVGAIEAALLDVDGLDTGEPEAPGLASDGEEPVADDAPPEAMPFVDEVVSIEAEGLQDDGDHREDVTTLDQGYEAVEGPAGDDRSSADEPQARRDEGDADEHPPEEVVEQLGGDALEDVPRRVSRPRRNYKIQEVIKRRQVLLVQVVKEERGNKGAALTTYLSLAGRYSVLMPNTARGGGISRKITDAEDRKRLKAIAQELEVPDGMGIILRTAGAARGIAEVKRDFEYLMRMWETVRETTLKSSAPTLVYEEGSLIKRSIRDLFNKDVDEVVVAGEEAYREARDFMRLLMPGQAKNVIAYRDPQPIFAKAGAEAQLDAMFSNQVVLRSGGYIVINQTEALVAIDVNSGRSTREHNIEDTALRTNLEAADEIARQLRLRDLAGLIVVDFIDMEEGRNDRAVERRIKDALKDDRARIQIGRISHFGLLEMSRQRMRTGVLEGSTVMCPHCAGSGTVRSISSIALHVLRMLEDALIKSAAYNLIVRTRSEVALYILNQKRVNLLDLESRFGVSITVVADPAITGTIYHAIERGTEATPPHMLGFKAIGVQADAAVQAEEEADLLAIDEVDEEELEADEEPVEGAVPLEQVARSGQRPPQGEGEGENGRRRKRRRRRRGRDGQSGGPREEQRTESGAEFIEQGGEDGTSDGEDLTDIENGFMPSDTGEAEAIAQPGDLDEAAAPSVDATLGEVDAALPLPDDVPLAEQPVSSAELVAAESAEPTRRRRSRRSPRTAEAATEGETLAAPAEADAAEPPAPAARRPRRPRAARAVEETPDLDTSGPSADRDVGADTAKQHPAEPEVAEPELPLLTEAKEVFASPAPANDPAPPAAPEAEPDPDRPKRSGWWQRAKATFTTGS